MRFSLPNPERVGTSSTAFDMRAFESAIGDAAGHQGDYPSQWKAINEIDEKLGVHHESLRIWVRKAETDAGHRPGLASDERERVKELEREVKELRRANEILKSASIIFATELDGRTRK
jgi:transposase